MIECLSHQPQVETPPAAPEWTDGLRQNIDQTAIDNVSKTLLRDLSFEPSDIDKLIGWCAQPKPVVWAAIVEMEIAGLLTWHCGNRLARIAPQ